MIPYTFAGVQANWIAAKSLRLSFFRYPLKRETRFPPPGSGRKNIFFLTDPIFLKLFSKTDDRTVFDRFFNADLCRSNFSFQNKRRPYNTQRVRYVETYGATITQAILSIECNVIYNLRSYDFSHVSGYSRFFVNRYRMSISLLLPGKCSSFFWKGKRIPVDNSTGPNGKCDLVKYSRNYVGWRTFCFCQSFLLRIESINW